MGRILVLLTFAGLAAVFVIIYNSEFPTAQSSAVSNSNTAQGNSRRSTTSQSDKKNRATSPHKATQKGSRYASPRTGANDPEASAPGAAAADPKRASSEAGGEPTATIKTDSAPVYSTNSKRSRVLRVLKRGEKVQPDVEIVDSGGRWRVVRPQRDKAGFVREEQIEQPATKSTNGKPIRE